MFKKLAARQQRQNCLYVASYEEYSISFRPQLPPLNPTISTPLYTSLSPPRQGQLAPYLSYLTLIKLVFLLQERQELVNRLLPEAIIAEELAELEESKITGLTLGFDPLREWIEEEEAWVDALNQRIEMVVLDLVLAGRPTAA